MSDQDVMLKTARNAVMDALLRHWQMRFGEEITRHEYLNIMECMMNKVLEDSSIGWALAYMVGVRMAPELLEKFRSAPVNACAPPPPPLPRRCRMCDWTDAVTGTSKQDAEKPRKWIQIDPELCSACADRRADTIQDLISRALGGDSVTWSTRIRGRIVVITIKEQPR